ncbi:MAG: tetraacyldisaccharide 4'-kinase [Gammaproteobacteria bacterium]|nr:tetraacyldisaccharide 4'-kinase [Gammaproteobacteria bacterium]MDH3767806.1 tetraacyldisaccharide 4'-kinase [Gammaproteobacteria bacterium]
MKLERWLLEVWYGSRNRGWWLAPAGWLVRGVSAIRRFLYRHGWLSRVAAGVPVIVIGNITAGGTGKTPLVIWLVQKLSDAGLRVGVLLRGYRGISGTWPVVVTRDTDPVLAGDEAVLIADRTDARVVADPDRVAGGRRLVAEGVQVIVSDDGLQHYRLARDAEIAVVDGARGIGNGRFIPAGPLRDTPRRLQTVTALVVNGETDATWPDSFTMQVTGDLAVSLNRGATRPLSGLAGQHVHAVAGIGNPQRFFSLLEGYKIDIYRHVFSDHARYQASDLQFDDNLPILMTEKDAVKCAAFATEQMWCVPVNVQFSAADTTRLSDLIFTAAGLTGGTSND